MARNNPVFQVMVTSGNSAVLAAGSAVSALAAGQLGFFDNDTNLSIDGTSLSKSRNFYIAVGVDDGAGGLGDIKRSAGQYIQTRHVTNLTTRCHTASQTGIFDVADFTVECNTDYGIRIGIANQAAYASYGFNTPSKTFMVRSSCCDSCATCASGDVNDMVYKLVGNINSDEDKVMTADLIASKVTLTLTSNTSASTSYVFTLDGTTVTVPLTSGDTPTVAAGRVVTAINALTGTPYFATNTAGVITIYRINASNTPIAYVLTTAVAGQTGTATLAINLVVAYANYAAFIAANPGVKFGIRVTTVPEAVNKLYSGSFNTKYDNPRGTILTPSLVEGFGCSGNITVVQNMAYEQGLGYDVAQMEYMAAGYNGSPYRQSELTGLINTPALTSSLTAKYVIIVLTYDFESVGGWEEYKNNLQTVIAIPCGDAATLVTGNSGIADVLDGIFGGRDFETVGTYLAACSCTGVNSVSDTNNANVDGIVNAG